MIRRYLGLLAALAAVRLLARLIAGEDYFQVAAGRLAGAGYAGLQDLL